MFVDILEPDDFSFNWINKLDTKVVPQSEIVVHGTPTGVIVKGALLEAAVRWRSYVLAFVTDDCPFEEILRVYLFDAQLNIVDWAVMGNLYSTGSFEELRLGRPDEVRFRFFGDTVWTITLCQRRFFTVPILSGSIGIYRPFRFLRHFALRGKPQPER
jgi:hypothetical protein